MAEGKKSGYHPGGGVRARRGRPMGRPVRTGRPVRARRTPIQPAPDPRGLRKRAMSQTRSTGRPLKTLTLGRPTRSTGKPSTRRTPPAQARFSGAKRKANPMSRFRQAGRNAMSRFNRSKRK